MLCHRTSLALSLTLWRSKMFKFPVRGKLQGSHYIRKYGTSSLHELVRTGNFKDIQTFLNGSSDKDVRDSSGLTPLMVAAREGKADIVQLLLEKGCRSALRSPPGLSAWELAMCWRHETCAEFLRDTNSPSSREIVSERKPRVHRLVGKRKDENWLQRTMEDANSSFILMHKSMPVSIPLITTGGSKSRHRQTKPTLLELSHGDISHLIKDDQSNLVFLGSHENSETDSEPSRTFFALDVSEIREDDLRREFKPDAEVLAMFPGFLRLSGQHQALAGQARSLLDWHFRYKFCATCGSPTKRSEAGHKRTCENTQCLSHKGVYNTTYPRVDPSVISLVLSPDNTRCLLGRSHSFLPGMFSCLAGFLEPGESVEEACHREVEEETGVGLDHVTYFGSQPWPMPSVLMLGCTARAREGATEIKLDPEELDDARWFSREETVLMLTRTHPERLFVAFPPAIAHYLVKEWILDTAFTAE